MQSRPTIFNGPRNRVTTGLLGLRAHDGDVLASCRFSLARVEGASTGPEVVMSKSADKPKKQQKKKPQKTLKERRSEKRTAKKFGPGSLQGGA